MRNALLVTGLVLAAAASASAAPVTFDTAATPAGTIYSLPTFGPGDVLFTENGTVVRVLNFTQGNFTGFNSAFIEAAGDSFPTRAMGLNNVQVRFDFTGLGFTVTQASFEYFDFGGSENLGVNGAYVELANLDLAPAFINGVAVSVVAPSGNTPGLVTFTSLAGISSIQVGGQEFVMDTVRAIPTPGALGLLGLGGLLAARRRRA
jgi:hypothetical protein